MSVGPVLLVVFVLIILSRLTMLVRPGLFSLRALRPRGADADARHREIDLIARLANLSGALGDERTRRDLDLDDVFHALDHTASEIGRQCLYARLRQPRLDPKQNGGFTDGVAAISADERLAASICGSVSRLSDRRSAFLVDLFFGELPPRPRLWWVFPILSTLAVGSLVAIPYWPRAFVALIAVAFVNVIVQVVLKDRVRRFVPAIHELPAFLRAAEATAELAHPRIAHEVMALRAARAFRSLRRASWWLMFEPGQTNELAASLYEYVNLILLFDVNAFVFAIEKIRSARPELQKIFLALGELDAMQSVAAWRASMPCWSEPTFVPREQRMDVQEVVHPLLAAPVANSLSLDGAGVLITGSNMSGKTTFIRTLGVNAVLAQTVATVCARRWSAPPVVVRTSIGRSDSILEGKSYYLAEAESIRALISAKETGDQYLFLLDEIFHGTNTAERIAAGYAVLKHLADGDDLVFVATHDVELIGLLDDRFAAYHFAEQISESALSFDYRIRAGASSTHNAIALLRLMQYPSEIVSDALSVLDANRLSRT